MHLLIAAVLPLLATAQTLTTTSITTSVTTATLTSTLPGAICSLRRMGCPIPEEYVDANYAILGNESGTGACQAKGTGSNRYFEFGVDECNATVVIDSAGGTESYTATLVPNIALGGIVFVEWPDIVCSCEVDMVGTVIATVVEVVDNTEQANIEGRSEFEPAMALYPDDTFAAPLPDVGGGFSVSSQRFFLGISSNSTDDIIGVVACNAAPTAAATDPFTQKVWEASCPVGPFDAGYHEHAPTNELHLSMRAFKFAGLDEVVLTCTIIRCPQEPCGVCDSDLRRRLQSGDAVDATVTRGLKLKAGPESNALVLPGVVPEDSLTSLFSLTAEKRSLSEALEASVTLLNCPVSSEDRYVGALEKALEAWLSMPDVELAVLEVMASGIRGASRLRRRLQSGAGLTGSADAVVVKFELVPTAQEDADDALARIMGVLAVKSAEDLATVISSTLESTFGGQVANLRVEKGLTQRRADRQVAEPEDSDQDSGKVDVVITVVVGAAALILGACLVCCGLVVAHCLRLRYLAACQKNRGHADASAASAEAPAIAGEADEADEAAPHGGLELGSTAEEELVGDTIIPAGESAPPAGGAETVQMSFVEISTVV